MLLSQSKTTDLFAAAYSGNIDVVDLLVQKFDLPTDQWQAVSISYPCLDFVTDSHFTYTHRISLAVLSPKQLPGDTLQW